jgi:hypothetical protein
MPIDEGTANRLLKLLRLTSSDFDSEALSAIRRANELLQASGLSWDDVIQVEKPLELPDWKIFIRECLSQTSVKLTGWERNFLMTIYRQPVITKKQLFCLGRIAARCRLTQTAA